MEPTGASGKIVSHDLFNGQNARKVSHSLSHLTAKLFCLKLSLTGIPAAGVLGLTASLFGDVYNFWRFLCFCLFPPTVFSEKVEKQNKTGRGS